MHGKRCEQRDKHDEPSLKRARIEEAGKLQLIKGQKNHPPRYDNNNNNNSPGSSFPPVAHAGYCRVTYLHDLC